jgi:ribosomal protein S1
MKKTNNRNLEKEILDFDRFETNNPEFPLQSGERIIATDYTQSELKKLYDMYTGNDYSYYSPVEGDRVKGKVKFISNDRVGVDIGSRQYAYLDLSKENKAYREYIIIDELLEILITEATEDTVKGSFSDLVQQQKFEKIKETIGDDHVAYEAKVVELIDQGGYWIEIDGIKAFLPGSLAGMNKLHDFESLVGENITVMPVNWSKDKQSIVVSHKKYLETLIPRTIRELDYSTRYKGFVTGSTSFGVFVQFNECLTGMIYKSDLDDTWSENFKKRNINPGEEIEFKVKEVLSHKKIILSQNYNAYDPWEGVEERYKQGTNVEGTIKKVKNFGIFIELEEGLIGLLTLPQSMTSEKLAKFIEGEKITVKLSVIDRETRKIFFLFANQKIRKK